MITRSIWAFLVLVISFSVQARRDVDLSALEPEPQAKPQIQIGFDSSDEELALWRQQLNAEEGKTADIDQPGSPFAELGRVFTLSRDLDIRVSKINSPHSSHTSLRLQLEEGDTFIVIDNKVENGKKLVRLGIDTEKGSSIPSDVWVQQDDIALKDLADITPLAEGELPITAENQVEEGDEYAAKKKKRVRRKSRHKIHRKKRRRKCRSKKCRKKRRRRRPIIFRGKTPKNFEWVSGKVKISASGSTMCYRFVKLYALKQKLCPHYVGGEAAKEGADSFAKECHFKRVPQRQLRAMHRKPVHNLVCSYSGGKYGHIETWINKWGHRGWFWGPYRNWFYKRGMNHRSRMGGRRPLYKCVVPKTTSVEKSTPVQTQSPKAIEKQEAEPKEKKKPIKKKAKAVAKLQKRRIIRLQCEDYRGGRRLCGPYHQRRKQWKQVLRRKIRCVRYRNGKKYCGQNESARIKAFEADTGISFSATSSLKGSSKKSTSAKKSTSRGRYKVCRTYSGGRRRPSARKRICGVGSTRQAAYNDRGSQLRRWRRSL